MSTTREGSPAKRAAIVGAALEVFLREGYARASVDAIAATSGVSKRTIYDYFGGKENLFLSTMAETTEAHAAAFQDLLDRTLPATLPGAVPLKADDTEAALIGFGREFATQIARSTERAAIMRLMIAEVSHFPALLERTRPGPVQAALAERLGELSARGSLSIVDAMEAAEFLGLLVTTRVTNRSWYGAVHLDDDEIERLVAGGVRVFLRAYGPRSDA